MRYVAPLVSWAVSIGLVLVMVNLGRRRAVLLVSEDRLRVEESRPFLRTRRGEWERGQLFAICAGPTLARSHFLELEIYPRGEPPFKLLYTGPAIELEWLADALRRGLGLGTRPAPSGVVRAAFTGSPSPAVPPRDSGQARLADWIGAAFVGIVCLAIVWNVLNGGGWLDHLGWPWPSVLLWAGGNAVVGLAGVALYRAHRRHQVRRLAEASRSMNLAFRPEASREDLGDFFYLRLFRRWSSTRNRMTGIVERIPVDMADYLFSSDYGRVTVLLLPAPASGLPPFELRPRGPIARFFGVGLADDTRTTARPYQGQPRHVRQCVERFRLRYDLRSYYPSEHLEAAAAQAVAAASWAALMGRGQADNILGADRAGAELAIRELFDLQLLHFFADRPGWCSESDGTHLALWRPYGTIRAAQRPRFVAEALEVHRALARAAARAIPKPRQAAQETENRQA
jgi:hypothetical protein